MVEYLLYWSETKCHHDTCIASMAAAIDERRVDQTSGFARRVGVRVNTGSKKIQISYSLSLFSKTYKEIEEFGVIQKQAENIYGDVITYSDFIEFEPIFSSWYLGSPISLSYIFSNKSKNSKLNAFVELGVIPSLYLGTQVKEKYGDVKTNTFEKKERSNLVTSFAAGFSYDLNEKFSFVCRPSFRIDIFEVFSDWPNPFFEYGMEIGIRRRIYKWWKS